MSHANFLVNGWLGGWQISAIALADMGPFMTPYDGDPADTSNPTPNRWFNLSAFIPTPAGARMNILKDPNFGQPPWTDVTARNNFGAMQTIRGERRQPGSGSFRSGSTFDIVGLDFVWKG